jgi:hypothetical protein
MAANVPRPAWPVVALLSAGIFLSLGILSNFVTCWNYRRSEIAKGHMSSDYVVEYGLIRHRELDGDHYPIERLQFAVAIPYFVRIAQTFSEAPNLGDSYQVAGISFFGICIGLWE